MGWQKVFFRGESQPPAPTIPLTPPTTSRIAPASTHRIQSANELLLPRGEWVQRIETLAGTTRPHFAQYYLPVIKRFAEFVQLCPASEAHHHAHLGGLLDHALEVAASALQIRQGYLLPPNAPAEERPLRQDTWTYAVFTGAFLHDVGKPAVDMAITLYSADGLTDWPWNPWLGRMSEDRQAGWYRMAYRKTRQYQTHERAALLLVQHLIPADGIAWLSADAEAFSAWLAYASGDSLEAGVLGEILTQADRHSVSHNLGAEAGPRAVQSHTIPLHEKLLKALRYLIEHQELPLNRNGAAGWRVHDDVWLVSKRVADALRAHLTLNGHGGIPSSNDRLFDVLQDRGALIPVEDRAIWRAEVRGENWANTLTLLRIPAQRLWTDPSQWPPEFSGEVVPVSSDSNPTKGLPQTSPALETSEEPLGSVVPLPHRPLVGLNQAAQSAISQNALLNWIWENLRTGQMTYNVPSARIHVVPEGVLLISPAIFQDFVAATNGTEPWKSVQKQFLKIGLHARTAAETNVHWYTVSGNDERIGGLLIPDASAIFASTPSINPLLSKSL